MCAGGPDGMDNDATAGGGAGGIGWIVREVDAPGHRDNRRLLAWYERLAADGHLPGRAEVDPADIRSLLHGVFLVEPAGDGDVRYRLVAAGIEFRLDVMLTGRTATEVFGAEMAAGVNAIYARVFDSLERVVLRGSFTGLDIGFLEFEALILPLRAPDGKGMMALGSMFAFDTI